MSTVIYEFDGVNDDEPTKNALRQTLEQITEFKPGSMKFLKSRTSSGKLFVTALFEEAVDDSSIKSTIQQFNFLNRQLGYNIKVHRKTSLKSSKTLYIKGVSKFLSADEATVLKDYYGLLNILYYSKERGWVCEASFSKPNSAEICKDYIERNCLFGRSATISFKF